MAYPDEWDTGATIGRNTCPMPAFPVEYDYGSWELDDPYDTPYVKPDPGAYSGNYLTGGPPSPQITLGTFGPADAGAAVTVTAQIKASTTIAIGDPANMGAAWSTTLNTGNPSAFDWYTVTATLPSTTATYLLRVAGEGIGAIRVDYADSPVAGDAHGYLDGSTTGLDGAEAAWDGTTGKSTTTVSATQPSGPASVVTIDPPQPQAWINGTPTTLQLTGSTTHDTPDLSWSVTDGSLPAGVSLDVTGLVSGTPEAEQAGAATVTAEDAAGASDSAALVWTVTAAQPDPDPDPEPEPEPDMDALAAALAPAVAAYLGKPGHAGTLEQAKAMLPIVGHFVRSYVRGCGWPVQAGPVSPIRAVLVSATARLVDNPTQVGSYQIADYSERPAVFNGYTLAEQGVLHNYRRRQA